MKIVEKLFFSNVPKTINYIYQSSLHIDIIYTMCEFDAHYHVVIEISFLVKPVIKKRSFTHHFSYSTIFITLLLRDDRAKTIHLKLCIIH